MQENEYLRTILQGFNSDSVVIAQAQATIQEISEKAVLLTDEHQRYRYGKWLKTLMDLVNYSSRKLVGDWFKDYQIETLQKEVENLKVNNERLKKELKHDQEVATQGALFFEAKPYLDEIDTLKAEIKRMEAEHEQYIMKLLTELNK